MKAFEADYIASRVLAGIAKSKVAAAKTSRQWSLNNSRQQDADVQEAEAVALNEQAEKIRLEFIDKKDIDV